jgi:hypothetical protein
VVVVVMAAVAVVSGDGEWVDGWVGMWGTCSTRRQPASRSICTAMSVDANASCAPTTTSTPLPLKRPSGKPRRSRIRFCHCLCLIAACVATRRRGVSSGQQKASTGQNWPTERAVSGQQQKNTSLGARTRPTKARHVARGEQTEGQPCDTGRASPA